MLAQTSRNTTVRAISKTSRAISLGVLRRLAPSIRPIIRSRKVSPGLAVIWTMMLLEMTVVPPVTALRSPPDSRITGADSPVTADSFTRAAPTTTSPSPAIISFASTRIRSPLWSWLAPTVVKALLKSGLESSFAVTSVRDFRRLAARALPRPSARASAKVEKMTVSQSQTETVPVNQAGSLLAPVSDRAKVTRVMTLAISTHSMTGLRHSSTGIELHKRGDQSPLHEFRIENGFLLFTML